VEQAELLRELRQSLEEEEDTELQLSGTKTLRLTPSGNYGFFVTSGLYYNNRTACIRHQCRRTTVLSSHRCIINTGVEKMNNI
jgi:hypothetical protein